jgi:TolB-like protein/class 3 adenylate cyclase/lipoprotein NlpI
MTSKSKRRLAAIMFTDMVGYTALMQEDETLARTLRNRHREVQKNATEKYSGQILQYFGDGTLLLFDSAVDAIEAAIEIQENLRQEPVVHLRIGIHTGDVIIEEDGIFGDGVNLASRIESLCQPGAVFFSEKAFDEIKNQPKLKTVSLGAFELKNVKNRIGIYAIDDKRVVIPNTSDFPSARPDKINSIAVLPFVNMSGNPENDYFSDGISEEILNALTRIKGLRVTSRTSSFAFRDSNKDIRTIGKTLNVGTILEGSVRWAGNRVRVTAQLIKTKDGYHYWSETYDHELHDIFALQDEISEKIAVKLKKELSNDGHSDEQHHEIRNMDAYKYYLQGMHHFYKYTPDDSIKSIEHFEKSIAKDPGHGPSYAGIANSLTYLGAVGHKKPKEVFPKAEKMARKAIELSPDNALSYVALGLVNLIYKWNLPSARSYFEKAIEVNPSAAEPYSYLGWYHLINDNFQKNLEYQQKAGDIDPLSVQINMNLGQAYFIMKEYENARDQYNRVLELEPSARAAYESLGWIELVNDNFDGAIEYFKKYRSFIKDPLKGWTAIGFAYAKAGKKEMALEALDKLIERQKKDKNALLHIDFAILNAGLGRMEEAFYHMNEALNNRLGSIIFIKTNPLWEFVRNDKRFKDIIAKFSESVIED